MFIYASMKIRGFGYASCFIAETYTLPRIVILRAEAA